MNYTITYEKDAFKQETEYEDTFSYVGILGDANQVIGFATYLIEDNILFLYYLTIREKYRTKHLADRLMMEIKDYASNKNLNGIIARFAVDESMSDIVSCLLVKHGFMLPTISEQSYRIPIANLSDTYLLKNEEIKNVSGKHIPISREDLEEVLDGMKGKINPDKRAKLLKNYDKELSLCTTDLKNNVVYTVSGQDIILELANAVKGATGFFAILYYSMKQIQERCKEFENLYVCAINDNSKKLIERLITGAEYHVTNLMDTYLLL